MATKKTTKAAAPKATKTAKVATKKAAPKKAAVKKASPAKPDGEKTKKVKATTAKKASADGAPKKLSAIDAAAKVLADAGTSMTTKEMIETMAAKGLWTSPGGKTPHATLYSTILREINTKGNDARFKKTERGKFAVKG